MIHGHSRAKPPRMQRAKAGSSENRSLERCRNLIAGRLTVAVCASGIAVGIAPGSGETSIARCRSASRCSSPKFETACAVRDDPGRHAQASTSRPELGRASVSLARPENPLRVPDEVPYGVYRPFAEVEQWRIHPSRAE